MSTHDMFCGEESINLDTPLISVCSLHMTFTAMKLTIVLNFIYCWCNCLFDLGL